MQEQKRVAGEIDPFGHRAQHIREFLQRELPEAFAEGQFDPTALKVALGEPTEDRPERYLFTWAGKREAINLLRLPTRATLIPAADESMNFDTTENLFIEGDNLEVLKLLYRAYFGRVKMIYIDPPYNTGNDFIYPDNFSDPLSRYLELTGQRDAKGNLLTSNLERAGRHHSAWLSMIYPRLSLARQLLREDGVIFVSIDDREVANLRLLMNEVFGEENFVTQFVRRRRMATGMRGEPVSPDHEYIVTFARSLPHLRLYGASRNETDYPLVDNIGKFRSTDLTVGMTREIRPNQFYEIYNPRSGKGYFPSENRVWRFQPSTMQHHIDNDSIIWPDEALGRNISRPRFKTRFDPHQQGGTVPISTWIDTKLIDGNSDSEDSVNLVAGLNQEATRETVEIFGTQIFDYPKPVSLLKALVALGTRGDDVILDFFAGSCTTAQAVLDQNKEDGSLRKFIMVQLPEPTGRADFPTIADVGKERIRRILARTLRDAEEQLPLAPKSDRGFRVFKLAESHLRLWRGLTAPTTEEYAAQLALFNDQLVETGQVDNIIWEVALRERLPLTAQIAQVSGVTANTVYQVFTTGGGTDTPLFICLDARLDASILDTLPLTKTDRFVCRDSALTDTLAANLAQQCDLKTL